MPATRAPCSPLWPTSRRWRPGWGEDTAGPGSACGPASSGRCVWIKCIAQPAGAETKLSLSQSVAAASVLACSDEAGLGLSHTLRAKVVAKGGLLKYPLPTIQVCCRLVCSAAGLGGMELQAGQPEVHCSEKARSVIPHPHLTD